MSKKEKKENTEKTNMHPRNKHRLRYNFAELIRSCAELSQYVHINKFGVETIDFANPEAVKVLNKALLQHFYGVKNWNIPPFYLCPPIPGRADYVHYAADLLASCNCDHIPLGSGIRVLDIGTGANGVYPLIGNSEYGWSFVGTDIDRLALVSAKKVVADNPQLMNAIQYRAQNFSYNIFKGVVKADEKFDLTVCNPPFHKSEKEAVESNERKVRNLGLDNSGNAKLNFGGQSTELWCNGGEAQFISNMITESIDIAQQCYWFTTIVSKKENLDNIYKALRKAGVTEQRTINMSHGQKNTRFVAWTFLTEQQRADWAASRWNA